MVSVEQENQIEGTHDFRLKFVVGVSTAFESQGLRQVDLDDYLLGQNAKRG